ncbi:SDR family oxidoreductase [Hufsiella ginkgonis]|uniref:SDR family oxidoreductase n=1 Tax=Hufsiella ginkgonis TaxID=2695274 RepID=A0A7K1XW14_9SPHI|nr:SDR family oxidoreductase [Hufsiella ginkgonis]MXV15185.1 SDR family oxidoreductase [Hufsiella ginkgonis]
MKDPFPLKDKTVVITGASSGVGRAAALEFAVTGARLVLAARNEAALGALIEECEAAGGHAIAVVTDVTEPANMIRLAEAANRYGGAIDVWINNAGVLAAGEFDKTPVEIHTHVIKTNLLGYLYGAHAVLPYFRDQQKGILINNISVGGYLPVPYGVGYSASKFGLRGFSQALKAELSRLPGIVICDLYPAFLDTPGIQHAANFTGKQLKPAPPVYDPRRVAQAMVSLAKNPRSNKSVGSIAALLRISYGLFPVLTRNITRAVIGHYLKQADPIPVTSGNVFDPLKFGTSTHGGWGLPGKPRAHRKYLAGGLLLIAAFSGFALLKNKR